MITSDRIVCDHQGSRCGRVCRRSELRLISSVSAPSRPPHPVRRTPQDTNTIYNELELLLSRARSTEAVVMVKLDIARNRILTAGLIFSMASTCISLGTLISGVFGKSECSSLHDCGRDKYTKPRRRPYSPRGVMRLAVSRVSGRRNGCV